ncbi:MAG TPA: thioredoxin domain-containing protein [Gammaproteobacteria bacterium]|nr:thioredoxin domain-containing protein [Gammaproteobacteria bacterium]
MPTPNRLAHETSPYLQQHAHNPVDWYPWGEEAMAMAKRENKPILLSIGYSACHWCHVMAHESFEDKETAQLMNQYFINIKVDREERPDLDKIYQTTHQMLTQSAGGWPLTLFLDPVQHAPFFSGTYFPKEPRYQLPAFKDLLRHIADIYQQQPAEITRHSQELLTALQQSSQTATAMPAQLNFSPWHPAVQQLNISYDSVNGGFGQAPKFPNPNNLELLLQDGFKAKLENNAENTSVDKVIYSLEKMASGGIYDQLGGGFYRYSVDTRWEIPHFEKMLYDNAQILVQYAHANAITPKPVFSKILKETTAWVLREMQTPRGGFYSALDADSEGVEGLFYLWTPAQMKTLLTAEEYQLLCLHFNLTQTANFEGRWHLHINHSIEKIAQKTQQPPKKVDQTIATAREKLFKSRTQRTRPALDDKILTSWNALMIKGLVLAANQLVEPELLDVAENTLKFIMTNLWRNQRLLATCKDGKAHLPAYLDDYAFLIDAILTFLQYRWDSQYLHFAQQLAEVLLAHFVDSEHGGFFFTADDHEPLIYRPKIYTDDVTPAGNSVACQVLQRLGWLLAEPRYLNAAEQILLSAWQDLTDYPAAHSSLLIALQEYINPAEMIILCGKTTDIAAWRYKLLQKYNPARIILAIPDDAKALPAAIAEKIPEQGVIAYRCKGSQCLSPISNFSELE